MTFLVEARNRTPNNIIHLTMEVAVSDGKDKTMPEHEDEIRQILSEDEVDLWKLRECALSEGGLVNDAIRRKAWPLLVGLYDEIDEDDSASIASSDEDGAHVDGASDSSDSNQTPRRFRLPFLSNTARASAEPGTKHSSHDVTSTGSCGDDGDDSISSFPSEIVTNSDLSMIELDVERSTWHLLSNGAQSLSPLMIQRMKGDPQLSKLIEKRQQVLAELINRALMESGGRYYQGYHSLASVFLSALGSVGERSLQDNCTMMLHAPVMVLQQASKWQLRDFVNESFDDLRIVLQVTLFPLIAKFDAELHEFLVCCDMEPYFAIPWVITWFASVFHETELVKRLFDVFLVSHALMPIYVAAAIIAHPLNRDIVLEKECEFSSVHEVLRGLPRNSCSDDDDGESVQPPGRLDGCEQPCSPGDHCSLLDDTLEFFDDWKLAPDEDIQMSRTNSAASDLDGAVEAVALFASRPDLEATQNFSLDSDADSEGSSEVVVPIQEVIELAIEYMAKVPPRQMLELSSRYYAGERDDLLQQASQTRTFRQSPDWALRSTVTLLDGQTSEADTAPVVGKPIHPDEVSLAIHAAGLGPGNTLKRQRRARRRILRIVAVVGLLVMCGLQFCIMGNGALPFSRFSKIPTLVSFTRSPIRVGRVSSARSSKRRKSISPVPAGMSRMADGSNNASWIADAEPEATTARQEAPTEAKISRSPCLSNQTSIDPLLHGASYSTRYCLLLSLLGK